MEWKSFEEKKPEIGSRVFICTHFDRDNIDVNLTQSHRIPTVWGTGGKLATHWMYIPEPPKPKKTYTAPKVGTVIAEKHLNEFIDKYSHWILFQAGCKDDEYLVDSRYNTVKLDDIRNQVKYPLIVFNVKDTDTITWIKEEF